MNTQVHVYNSTTLLRAQISTQERSLLSHLLLEAATKYGSGQVSTYLDKFTPKSTKSSIKSITGCFTGKYQVERWSIASSFRESTCI